MELTDSEKTLIKKLRRLQTDIPVDQYIMFHLIPLKESYVLQAVPMKPLAPQALRPAFQNLLTDIKNWAGKTTLFLLDFTDQGILRVYGNRGEN